MPSLTLTLSTDTQLALERGQVIGPEALRYLNDVLTGAQSGHRGSNALVWCSNDSTALGENIAPSVGAFVLSSASGSVGGTIAGTSVTVTASGGDTATATALAAAIRANATVNRLVTASNLTMGVTLASVTAGQYIDVCGVRFTAKNGAPTLVGEFDMSGSDTADAASLALAINRHPALSLRFRAVSSAAVVRIAPYLDRPLTPMDRITNSANFSTFTAVVAEPTAGAYVLTMALNVGAVGNLIALVASGTGSTAIATSGGSGYSLPTTTHNLIP